ncbi:delta-like protein C [Pomacea canaliculata]|uniref:delta-like protein C n=1 Tax=Pomacea canaliculata TaxID=400727 RepID=UPI000D727EA6|nr:delta-like protein C [Pomacea canaliculata]
MMIDPGNLKNREACIETGSGEERRCYLVGLVNDTNDPCDVKPCHNGGQCINTPPSYVCACPTQYSASGNCDEQDTSSVEPSTLLTTSGVDHSSVTAVSSVSSPMTPTTVSLKCAILNCSADALCTLIQSKPVCLCPLGQSGVQCLTRNENIPVNSDADQLNPHAVVPTLPSGLQITCDVGDTCKVPVYVNGNSRFPLTVNRGPSPLR